MATWLAAAAAAPVLAVHQLPCKIAADGAVDVSGYFVVDEEEAVHDAGSVSMFAEGCEALRSAAATTLTAGFRGRRLCGRALSLPAPVTLTVYEEAAGAGESTELTLAARGRVVGAAASVTVWDADRWHGAAGARVQQLAAYVAVLETLASE